MGQVEEKGANAFGVHGESIDVAYRYFSQACPTFICFRGSFLLFVIPAGNLRFARIAKATPKENCSKEPLINPLFYLRARLQPCRKFNKIRRALVPEVRLWE
jgi:hypothetical protein